MGNSSPSCIQRSNVMDSQAGGRPYPFRNILVQVLMDSSSPATRTSSPSTPCRDSFISCRSIAMPGVSFEKRKPCLERAGRQSEGFSCGSSHQVRVCTLCLRKYSTVSLINDSSPSPYGWEDNTPLNHGCGSGVYQRENCLFSKCSSGPLRLRWRKKSHMLA